MNTFPRGRYNSEEFVRGFDSSPVGRNGDEVCITFEISSPETEELTVYFPSCTSDPPAWLLIQARDICAHISEFDDLVQQSCEDEWRRSGLPAESFALSLAYIKVHPEMLALEYYGTHVNTEWDALFEKTADGRWEKLNF